MVNACFGTGECFRKTISILKQIYQIELVCDNDDSKWNKWFDNLKCVSPNELKSMGDVRVFICVYNNNRISEIEKQLNGIGIYNIDNKTVPDIYKKIIEEKERIMLEGNSIFKNCHNGERCFILGNGPSLKNTNLKFLKNEHFFIVNSAYKIKELETIHPTYHVIADGVLYNDCPKNDVVNFEELKRIYKNIETEKCPCFISIAAKKFLEEYELDKKIDFHYFKYSDEVSFEYMVKNKKKVNICNPVPGFSTVVQYAIMIALYMGFSEIFLLGYDCTEITNLVERALNLSANGSSYVYGEDNILLNQIKPPDVFWILKTQTYLFECIKLFVDYCSLHSAKIYNCTPLTLDQYTPHMDFKKIVNT